MRARNIKPGYFDNEELGSININIHFLFSGLWCMADKDGRLTDQPKKIKAKIFPYRDEISAFDVEGYLSVLHRLGFIHRYGNEKYAIIQIVNWTKHQSPHHSEKPSQLPDFEEVRKITVVPPLFNGRNPPDSLIPDSGFSDSLIADSLSEDSGFKTPPPQKLLSAKNSNEKPKAVEAILEISGIEPDRVLWEHLAEVLGEKPDVEKLKACYVEWRLRGQPKKDLFKVWAIEWYLYGIPPMSHPNIKAVDPGKHIPIADKLPECPTCQDVGKVRVDNPDPQYSFDTFLYVPCPENCQASKERMAS